ncbi:molybdate ABC transporter substrate-binding protein [uncultured Sunxiuqinia sp.]|uniref:molybdate ABC transporter substrate-binding protein n=1 Tax=uncultured Sunxiuqinia sp. TaxID=1573825 RepID=UPI002AA908AF|nr:molybdate ABC transporter substrate-binding protein [uncultured Sunxiuqinia sp.]
MKRILYAMLSLFLLVSCSGSKRVNEKEIKVFAAASLTDVITKLAQKFEQEYNVTVKLNLAASGTLARQIDQGAEADVYLSANKNWMDFLVEKQKTKETAVFAKNDLVLISPLNKDFQFKKVDSLLTNSECKIAIGDPGFVPAGKYAMQVFDYYQLNLEDRYMQSQNVRSALMMVELGEADFGVVYKTDALQSKKVNVIYIFPEETHKPVEYFRALISDKNLAKQFYDYLYSAETDNVLTNYSFIID